MTYEQLSILFRLLVYENQLLFVCIFITIYESITGCEINNSDGQHMNCTRINNVKTKKIFRWGVGALPQDSLIIPVPLAAVKQFDKHDAVFAYRCRPTKERPL